MHTKHSRFPVLTTGLAALFLVNGCVGKLPSHDGSLNRIYGIETPSGEQPTVPPETTEPQAVEPNEDEPQVQTLSYADPIRSAPLTAIEVDPEPIDKVADLAENTTTVPPMDSGKTHYHVLGAGETLYSVANQLTGASSNWKEIADFNAINDPGSVSVGQEIRIPLNLVKLERGRADGSSEYTVVSPANNAIDQTIDPEPISFADSGAQESVYAENSMDDATMGSLPVGDYQRVEEVEESVIGAEDPPSTAEMAVPVIAEEQIATIQAEPIDQNVATTEAAAADVTTEKKKPKTVGDRLSSFASIIKTSFKLPKKTAPPLPGAPLPATARSRDVAAENPMTTEPVAVAQSAEGVPPVDVPNMQIAETAPVEQTVVVAAEEWIQIEGDFTPKAVYKSADYASGLLMRVPPGTTLKLTSQSGDWYQVETDVGSGYVFHRDALPVR